MILAMGSDSNQLGPYIHEGMTLSAMVGYVEDALVRGELTFGHGTDNARDEAVWLVLAALQRSPVDGTVDPEEPLDRCAIDAVQSLLERRLREHRPLAYLTGTAWFAGLALRCDERALVPRSPLAEPILERFEPWIGARPAHRILDLGTGNGCIALACAYAFPEASIDATDVDADALTLAQTNVDDHGLRERIALHRGDLFEAVPIDRRFDLIVSNPPYVDAPAMTRLPDEYRHEPAHGLSGGTDGLAVAERILAQAPRWLRPGGLLVVEVGRAGATLARRHPGLGLVWLEFEHGGAGVFAVLREELEAAGLGR